MERSYSSCAKATCSSELENVVFHEDEAHFGDLFCESGRGLQKDNQPPVVANSSSGLSIYMLTLAPSGFHIEILLVTFHL
ncbi:hypothetical protein GBA52_012204 [Prunus armeniaca]|nr:hypothetical protein GBA52_012204 [Prunus armeniaca]